MILAAVERVLEAHGIPRRGADRVLVACSGGVDSAVLAHAAATVLGGRRVVLGHVDHAVRAGSADDARAVQAYGAHLGVEVRVARLPPGPDDEARLREDRYRALESQRVEAGARYVLTAHTRDDQAETVLLGLLRSARPSALRGIPVARGAVLRPLLTVSRAEVGDYANRHRVPVREDPTNVEPRYLRNRIRKELLPLLERRYRPQLTRRLAGLAARMTALLSDGDRSPVGQDLKSEARGSPVEAPVHPWSDWQAGCQWLKMERRPWLGGPVPDGREEAAFDVRAVLQPRIRLARPGDRIRPYGMSGHRKLRDLLREAGVPTGDRAAVPVVVDGQGRVLWLPGAVRSALAPVQGTTREVWWFSIGRDHELQATESRATLDAAVGDTEDPAPGDGS